MQTIQDLIDRLTDIAEVNPDARVMIGTQPSWPLAFTLSGIAEPADLVDLEDDEDEPEDIVWLVAGDHPYDRSPYAPRALWDAAR